MQLDQVQFAIIAISGIVVTAIAVTTFAPQNTQLLSNIIMGAIGAIAGLAGNTVVNNKPTPPVV